MTRSLGREMLRPPVGHRWPTGGRRGWASRLAVLFATAAVVLGMPGAWAYEGDHYVWTYYLALHTGFTPRQASQIASATYAIDWDRDTGPMPEGVAEWVKIALGYATPEHRRKWTRFHAFAGSAVKAQGGDVEKARRDAATELWTLAVEQRNPGPFLHFSQDFFAHDGWDDVRGHGTAGHLPDFLSCDYPDHRKSWAMTLDTIKSLVRFRQEVMGISEAKPVDYGHLQEVLQQLINANPLPAPDIHEPLRQDNPEVQALYGGDSTQQQISILLKSPSLESSLAVINQAIREDQEAGRLPQFPDRNLQERDPKLAEQVPEAFRTLLLAPKWRQFDFDPMGRVQDATYPVEGKARLTLNAPKVTIEKTPEQQEADKFVSPDRRKSHVRITLPAHVTICGGKAEPDPVALVDHHEFDVADVSGGEGLYDKKSHVRYVVSKDEQLDLEAEIDVSDEALRDKKVAWTGTVQVYGSPPQMRTLRITRSNSRVGPIQASADPGGPPLVAEGCKVSGFGDRSTEAVDGWVPFRFTFPVPSGGVESAEFVLVVRPIGQLIETDTFHCIDSKGQWANLHTAFTQLPTSRPSVLRVPITAATHPTVIAQLNQGLLRCCLQDDTALISAQLILNP